MKAINATTQIAVVARITALVEQAKAILGDEARLDVLDGPEGQNLSELQSRLIDASACLRALTKQLTTRLAADSVGITAEVAALLTLNWPIERLATVYPASAVNDAIRLGLLYREDAGNGWVRFGLTPAGRQKLAELTEKAV